MARQIEVRLKGTSEGVVATLLDDAGEYADRLWDELNNPVDMWTVQTVSTGDWFTGIGRLDPDPQATGTQAAPLGRSLLMCDVEQGSIEYGGHRNLGFAYGPDITEPLPTHGPVVARADDLSAFYAFGSRVCDSHFKSHELAVITVSRKDA